ncbi:hypothetical protein BU26DRAFT_53327 [Trematosphaeria pertusa]|uniref:DUF7730 domain-containing protein n=1 Tax=Trematosphaeria pertusa TaxID=390896 RepID=A0A6A6IBA6_9PLEO|nr:uncharacterized protein BU26DRAFT_53327 [Trematosphaeria pertusa]KAF2246773.1 hypothetical protein BU26DRAFT_53327 [Trematosphaeria pertusa]
MRNLTPIPKLTSPSLHTGLSFLSLHPEIRNIVYSLLLGTPSTIVFQYVADQHYVLNQHHFFQSHDNDNESSPPPPPPPRITPASRAAVSRILASTNLMRTCRQIYHETASMLYSKHTFTFAKIPQQHVACIGQLAQAVVFCAKLASGLEYLRAVVIDLDGVCAHACAFPHVGPARTVDLAPLARVVWAKGGKCAFEFARSGAGGGLEFEVERMNNVLGCIARDTLGLRKYAAQILSMETYTAPVVLSGDDGVRHQFGAVVFGQAGEERRAREANWARCFLVEDGGKTMRFEETEGGSAGGLLSLSKLLRERIFEYVLCPPKGIFVNVDTKAHSPVDLSMTSSDPLVDFDDFRALEKLFCRKTEHGGFRYPWTCHFDPGHKLITIELRFVLKKLMTLTDLRISIMSLLRITAHADGKSTNIVFSLPSSSNTGIAIEKQTVPLHSLRARVLELLSQVNQANAKEAFTSDFRVFVDGTGAARNVVIGSSNQCKIFHDHEFVQEELESRIRVLYGKFGEEDRFSPVRAGHPWPVQTYDGSIIHYLRYLGEVMKKTLQMQKYSDDWYARKFFALKVEAGERRSGKGFKSDEVNAAWEQ